MSEDNKTPDLQAQMENLWESGTRQRAALAAAIREWRDDGFMIKSITLKSLVPPRYRGGESA